MRPRRPLGRIGTAWRASFDLSAACDISRPLNFTVRSHFGAVRRREESGVPFDLLRGVSALADSVVLQASSLDIVGVRVRRFTAALEVGARAERVATRQQCEQAPGPQGTQVPSFKAWARLTWEYVAFACRGVAARAQWICEGDF